MPERKRKPTRKKKRDAENVVHVAYTVIIAGLNLYRQIKPLLDRRKKRKKVSHDKNITKHRRDKGSQDQPQG